LAKKIWRNIVFYKRSSIFLFGIVFAVALYFFWGEMISGIFALLVIWMVIRIYPSKIKGKGL
jgi:hypothetical protein